MSSHDQDTTLPFPSGSHFAIVPDALWQTVSPRDVTVYCALASFADYNTGLAWPSRATIAGLLSMSVKTVDRSLKTLEDAGFVRKTHRVGADGEPQSNLYELPFAVGRRFGGSPKSVAPPATPVSLPSPTDVPLTRPSELDTEPPPTPPTLERVMLPEEVLARRWCEITGQKPTRSVLAKSIPQVREYLAVSEPPSDDLLRAYWRRGIKTPAGWGFVGTAADTGGAVETSPARNDPSTCKHRAVSGGGWCAGCSTQVAVKDVDGNLRWLPKPPLPQPRSAGSPSAHSPPMRTTTIVNFLEDDQGV